MDKKPKPIYANSKNTEAVKKGYEMGGYLKNRIEIEEWEATHKKEQKCPAPDANDEGKSSPLTGEQQGTGPSVSESLTLLLSYSEKIYLEMMEQKNLINDLRGGMAYLADQVKTLVDALAEDQDPDEPITSYLSGKPV